MDRKTGAAEKYALFQSECDDGIYCAVRLGLGAPAFIQRSWVYREVISAADTTPRQFKLDAARRGVALNGYYIFMQLE